MKLQKEENEQKINALQEHNDELTVMENSAKRDIAVSFKLLVVREMIFTCNVFIYLDAD